MLPTLLNHHPPTSVPAPRRRPFPGLLLGWNQAGGYMTPDMIQHPGYGHAVTYDGDAPLVSCSITGGGKGRGVLIPNMLTYPGLIIAIDIKGEIFQVTSRCRREMGHQVVALDPFHLVTKKSDSLNPLDLLTLPCADPDSDSEMLASLLSVGQEIGDDPYWNVAANGLISGADRSYRDCCAGVPASRPIAGLDVSQRHGYGDRKGARRERHQEPYGA